MVDMELHRHAALHSPFLGQSFVSNDDANPTPSRGMTRLDWCLRPDHRRLVSTEVYVLLNAVAIEQRVLLIAVVGHANWMFSMCFAMMDSCPFTPELSQDFARQTH